MFGQLLVAITTVQLFVPSICVISLIIRWVALQWGQLLVHHALVEHEPSSTPIVSLKVLSSMFFERVRVR